jgi:Kef-type K+ transport system membrane component KefB
VVLADMVVILLFAIVSTLAKATLGESTDALATAGALTWEILGSAVVGVVLGMLIALYLRNLKGGALFILAVCLLVSEVGTRVHFDPLLVSLAAGIFIRNASDVGQRLHREIESGSYPVYVAFFAVTGAGLDLSSLTTLAAPVVLFSLFRAGGFFVGTYYAAKVADAPASVRRYGSFGLMSQAGLALALAILFQRAFPYVGADAAALVLGCVALNQIVAPPAFRWALIKAGEAGKLERGDAPDLDGSQLPDEVGAAPEESSSSP